MGLLYSAARDPLFFAHHGNIDRMWYIWREKLSCSNTDADWLNASFLFYDEERRLVRVRDCLDITVLRYKYEDVPIPWRCAKLLVAVAVQPPPPPPDPGSVATALPATLDKRVRVPVRKPLKKEKEEEEKEVVLLIEDINIADHSRYVNNATQQRLVRPFLTVIFAFREIILTNFIF